MARNFQNHCGRIRGVLVIVSDQDPATRCLARAITCAQVVIGANGWLQGWHPVHRARKLARSA
jgi:hypothetical protein